MAYERDVYYGITNSDGSHPKMACFEDRCALACYVRDAIENRKRTFDQDGVHVTRGDVITALRFVLADYDVH